MLQAREFFRLHRGRMCRKYCRSNIITVEDGRSCWSKNRTMCLQNHHDCHPYVFAQPTRFHLQMDARAVFCLWRSACNPSASLVQPPPALPFPALRETDACLAGADSRNLFSNSSSASNIQNSPRNISSTPLWIGKNRQMGSPIANSTVHALVKRQLSTYEC